MFLEPLNLNLSATWEEKAGGCPCTVTGTMHERVCALFYREGWIGWVISYETPAGEIPHLLVKDTRFGGYAIGVLVYKLHDGFIVGRLENPGGRGMTEWKIPFKGQITPGEIVEKICSCIEVFENETIPDPDEEDQQAPQITK